MVARDGPDADFHPQGRGGVTLPGQNANAPRGVTGHVDTWARSWTQVKPNGRLTFERIGGYPFFAVNGEYCQIRTADGRTHTGTAVLVKSSVHVNREPVADKEWRKEEVEIRLDAAVFTADQARALGIEVGDIIAWDPRTTVTETGYIKSRHLDDKAGVAVMLGALKALVDGGIAPAQRSTFHFSNFEEVATARPPASRTMWRN